MGVFLMSSLRGGHKADEAIQTLDCFVCARNDKDGFHRRGAEKRRGIFIISKTGSVKMTGDYILSKPTRPLLSSYAKALEEGFEGWPIGDAIQKDDALAQIKSDPDRFIGMITNFKPDFVILPDGTKVPPVPNEALWLSKDNEFLGAFNLRLELSANLKLEGGNVGYEIRESCRGQGIATIGLALVKKHAWEEHGLQELLITCSPNNIASERVIVKNGGVYQDTLENPHGAGPIKRFKISLG